VRYRTVDSNRNLRAKIKCLWKSGACDTSAGVKEGAPLTGCRYYV
jgi:hypothetical protein